MQSVSHTGFIFLGVLVAMGSLASTASANETEAKGADVGSQLAVRRAGAESPVAEGSSPAPSIEKGEGHSLKDRLHLSGFVDVYYAWNANRPSDGESFFPGTGSTAKRANAFGLNLVALDLAIDPAPVGVHVTLADGSGLDVIHAGEPTGSGIGPGANRFVYQAYLSYRLPGTKHKLVVDAGILPCHAGLEGFFSKDNWTYTRSWMAELSPYYQTGVRVSYQFTDHLSGQVHVMNGWQLIGDDNDAKTLGTQVAWDSRRVTFSVNTIAGPELVDDDRDWRLYLDTVLTVRPLEWLSVAATVDVARQQLPEDDDARWWGAQGLVRLAPSPKLAVYLRGERFSDPDAGISGFSQRLTEGTIGLEYRPAESLILKLEGRYDRSTADVFALDGVEADGTPERGRGQTLVVLGAVVTF